MNTKTDMFGNYIENGMAVLFAGDGSDPYITCGRIIDIANSESNIKIIELYNEKIYLHLTEMGRDAKQYYTSVMAKDVIIMTQEQIDHFIDNNVDEKYQDYFRTVYTLQNECKSNIP